MNEVHIEASFVPAGPAAARVTVVRGSKPADLSRWRGDTLDYYLIYAVGFVIFLIVALVRRGLPRRLRSIPCDPSVRRSVITEARIETSNMIPFAFMG